MRWVFVLSMVVFCFHAAHADAATRNVERTQTSIGVPKAVVMIAQASSGQQSGDEDTAAAIISAGTAIDEAFANNDKEAIRALLIPGHISVTPYYDGPQSVEDQIASVSDFADYTQTIVGEPSVQMLSSDVGVKSFIADLTGSFKGTPLPARVFVGQIMVKRDGKWIGGFYQVTTLKP